MADSLVMIKGETTYTMKREIASGGMGSVYEADQSGVEGFKKTIAIKNILPKYTDDKDFVEMFIGEGKLVANLVHPNIVQIYQLGKYENGYYIAMEYIDGLNLEQFLDRHKEMKQRAPIDFGTFIISRVCRGLEYAHNKHDDEGELLGIVHRDVSPKNIMLTSEGETKLTDFGIAKAANLMKQKEGEVLMGKVEYMSPEQASFQVTDHRSDIFSLGVVYYEVLTGINIFETDDVEESMERVKKCDIPDPRDYRKDIPEDVVKIVMRCLEQDVEKRYPNASELGNDLEYHMYSDGYGPTIVKLASYLQSIFPDRHFYTTDIGQGDSDLETIVLSNKRQAASEKPQ